MLMPNRGRGLISGSAVRDIMLLAGIKDVTAKIISSSKNKLNIARAAIIALSAFDKKRQPVVSAEPKTETKTEVKK